MNFAETQRCPFNPASLDDPSNPSDGTNTLFPEGEELSDRIIEFIKNKVIWGLNTYSFVIKGGAQWLKNEMKIPDQESYLPFKIFSVAHIKELIVITDPEMMNRVLLQLRDGDTFSGGAEFNALSEAIGKHNPLTEKIDNQRKREKSLALNNNFGCNTIRKKTPIFFKIAKNFIQKTFDFENNQIIYSASDFLPKYILRVNPEAIFNIKDGLCEVSDSLSNLEQMVSDTILCKPRRLFRELDSTNRKSKEQLNQIVQKILELPKDNENLISKMEDEKLDPTQIESMIKTVLMIGFGTSKSTLTSALYSLLKNPEYQEQLYAALIQLELPSIEDIPLEDNEVFIKQIYDNLIKCKEINNFLLEVMRIYTPIPVQSRKSVVETTIGELNICANTTIYLAPYLSHLDEKYWENPLEFNPSRFNDESIKRKFLPFSTGQNICMGRFHALSSMIPFIYFLVINFRIIPPLDEEGREITQELEMVDNFTYQFNKDLKISLERRQSIL